MKKLLYIYNPAAGRRTAKASLSDVVEVFSRQGYEITVHPTQGRGDATRTVLKDGGGFDRVVCCGGDGTLNETVQGLLALPADKRPVLGYIPAGTTNDFSRTLELPRTLPELAEAAGAGTPRPIDVGEAAGRPFTYVAAFGLFTDVSYSTPQANKNLLGHFAYLLEGMGRLASIPSYHMKVSTPEGKEVEGDFIYGMVGNTVSVGGLVNLPRDKVLLDDGRFEVILIRQPKTAKDWQSILTALTTLELSKDGEGAVVGFSAGEVTFTCDAPVAWTVDGEFGGEQQITTVKNLPRALTIACGAGSTE
ncbi:MAG: diacylglycerol kinase family lipid kinase [Oscillospiraceae bacterium]|jgi:diacylglycerol kinase (ATP)|nr:diacylglycerol kinase family lipid kinase [Oscillospiraceae bacterium]